MTERECRRPELHGRVAQFRHFDTEPSGLYTYADNANRGDEWGRVSPVPGSESQVVVKTWSPQARR